MAEQRAHRRRDLDGWATRSAGTPMRLRQGHEVQMRLADVEAAVGTTDGPVRG